MVAACPVRRGRNRRLWSGRQHQRPGAHRHRRARGRVRHGPDGVRPREDQPDPVALRDRVVLRRERDGHTLQTTALVNEAYVRLAGRQKIEWQDRSHFFAVTANVMRHILIDHARRRHYAKRGGDAQQVALDEADAMSHQRARELVALDEALEALAKLDPRKSQVVELRYFGGLSMEETAEVLEVSLMTVRRDWRVAKAWLFKEVNGEP